MTTAEAVETTVTVNKNSPIEDYVPLDDQARPTFEMTPGFEPFTVLSTCSIAPGQAQASNDKIHIVFTGVPLSHYQNLNSNIFYKQKQEFER